MNATIKLLLIVREPVTRAISDYTQLKSHAATATLPQQSSPSIASSSSSSSSSPSSSVAFSPISKYNSPLEIFTIQYIDDFFFLENIMHHGMSRQSSSRTFEDLAILPNGTVNEAYRPLSISMYHLHMHRWLEVFSREQLLVVNGDRLIDDPLSQLRRIETFLGMYSLFYKSKLFE